jgi:hypothetical protein
MATMIVNAYKYLKLLDDKSIVEEYDFNDLNEASNFSKNAILYAKHLGIINGIGNNLFAPKSCSKREEAAKMIYILLETTEKL